eukprot:2569205-Pleurochrysis_carterae.AAC.2
MRWKRRVANVALSAEIASCRPLRRRRTRMSTRFSTRAHTHAQSLTRERGFCKQPGVPASLHTRSTTPPDERAAYKEARSWISARKKRAGPAPFESLCESAGRPFYRKRLFPHPNILHPISSLLLSHFPPFPHLPNFSTSSELFHIL